MKGIDRFQFGLSVARGLDLAAELHARSAQDAQALAQMIAMATAMMGQQKGAEDLARGLDVKVEGESVRIALSVPEQALAQAVKARMAGGPAMRARPAVATGAAAEPAPAPAAPKRDPRFAPDTALIVTGAESDGGSVIFSYPKK